MGVAYARVGDSIHFFFFLVRDPRATCQTLVFFAALFCAMSALEELGLIDYLGNATASMIRQVGGEASLSFRLPPWFDRSR